MTATRINLSGLDLEYRSARFSAQPLQDLAAPDLAGADTAGSVHKMAINGPIEKVKAAYHRLEFLYHKHISLTFRRRVIQLQSGLSKGGKLLSTAYKAFDPILSIFRNSVLTGEKLLAPFKGFTKTVKKTRLFSVFSIPVALYGVIKESIKTAVSVHKEKYGDASEHGLNIMDNMGDLSHSIGTFIDGLEVCDVITGNPALESATHALAIIGTVFSIASIALQTKFIHETNKLRNRMITVFCSEEEPDFKAVVDVFDSYRDSRLSRHVGVSDGSKLKARMHAIYERNKDFETDETQKKNLNDTFEALKKRIKWNNFGRYLKITAAVITIIASIILLCTPGAPIAYALMAIATAIGIAVLIMDYKMESNLNNHLKSLAPNDCSEMKSFYDKRQWKKKIESDPRLRMWDLGHGRRAKERQPVERLHRSYEYEDIRHRRNIEAL